MGGGGSSSSAKKSKSSAKAAPSREELIAKEIIDIEKNMKIGEMKTELKAMGIPTRSFFEKSEFVQALAKARVDGKQKAAGGGGSQQDEPFDPSYRDVVMQKFTGGGLRFGGFSDVIDVRLGK